MPRVLFTADTHFGHSGIISMCQRPWSSAAEMDDALVENWNAVVGKNDIVWHLGDFAYKCDFGEMKRIFNRLNGEKHLVLGNHDRADTLGLAWKSTDSLVETVIEGQRIVMCHYSLRTWNGQRRGAISLYGHSHGRLPGTSQSADVGVDCWGYCPASLAEIKQRLVTQPLPETEGDPGNDNGGPTP